MENEIKTLGALLVISGCANIVLAVLLFWLDKSWTERYVALANKVWRSKNQPEAPEPQEVIK